MNKFTRRDFLKTAGAASLAASGILTSPLSAMMGGGDKYPPSLVCIYLRGGADWLNMVIPYKDRDYHTVRPTLGLSKEHGVINLDGKWGLHPALSAFEPLFQEKMLAPVVAVGSPHTTRSHFDAQDFMEFAAPGNRGVRTGWLNRYLVETSKKRGSQQTEFRGMAMQELLPRSLRGDFPVLAVPGGMDKKKGSKTLSRFEEFYGASGAGSTAGEGAGEMGAGEMDAREDDPSGVVRSGKVTIETLRRYQDILAKGKSEVKYPSGRFGQRMQNIAKVFKAGEGLEIAGVDYNGWDHHAQQGGVEGRQADMLRDLSGSIAAFCADMGPRMENTTVVVMTEFGRTVRENGNNGTDHGHGGGAFLIGGGVKGGKVHGKWKGLGTDALYEGRDLQVTTDFRDLFHSVLEGTFKFKPTKGFFPDYGSRKISGLY
jgi:uncharacterized protein (DUF1501 family)